ncbi:MAG: condensation domain-containing protein, partial [Cyanobacteria bacterium P01_F01_bin.42]
ATNEIVTGAVPLTPIQHDFFQQNQPHPNHYNQAILLEIARDLNLDALRESLAAIWSHHDALRMIFEPGASDVPTIGWQQTNQAIDAGSIPLIEVDLSHEPAAEQNDALQHSLNHYQADFLLETGPLFKAVFYRMSQGDRLLLGSHHLIIDGVSWRILLDDLQTAYGQALKSQPIQLPPKSSSYQTWAQTLQSYSENSTFQADIEYWQKLSHQPIQKLPVDQGHNLEQITIADRSELQVGLSQEETKKLLTQSPKRYGSLIHEVLLTALAQTLGQWSQSTSVLMDVESHGRHPIPGQSDIDVSRTVGWFTNIFPLRLNLMSGASEEQVQWIKEQIHQIPNQGLGYGVWQQTLSSDEFKAPAQILFNYLGTVDISQTNNAASLPIIGLASESPGDLRSLKGTTPYLLDIVASVQNGELNVLWRYSSKHYQPFTIKILSQRFCSILRSLIADNPAQSKIQSKATTEFAAARIDQGQLNRLMAKLQGGQNE